MLMRQRLAMLAARANDGVFGEDAEFLPFTRPENGRAQADKTREKQTIKGIYVEAQDPKALDDPRGVSVDDKFGIKAFAGEAAFVVAVSAFPDPEAWPREGDRIKLTDRPKKPTLEIIAVEHQDTQARLELHLSKKGG